MIDLINGRTPEEIRAAVINCDEHCSCIDCPEDERDYCDQSVVIKYARCLIQHLESERDAALAKVPVVHARWIEDGYHGIPCVCSHCGEEAHYTSTFREQFDYDWEENLVSCGYEEIKEYIQSKCCPECGARMDGKSEEDTDGHQAD